MSTNPSRQQLLDQLISDPAHLHPEVANFNHLYPGTTFHRYPSKTQLRVDSTDKLVMGWQPERPIIGPDTRVLALGSCFASSFVLWLADHGFNRLQPASAYNTLLRYGSAFESTAVLAQQFRWAFGQFNPASVPWLGPDKQLVRATEQQQAAARNSLQQSDVLILTLGLSEIWYDRVTGEPLWRAIPRHLFNPERHAFRVLTVAETVACLQEIETIRAAYLPGLKIVFTVSPMHLRATFRPISAVTANSASKAVIRAALDEFLRSQPEALGRSLFYFPSYEMVTDIFRDPFTEDNSHIQPTVVEQVLDVFARTYTSLAPAGELSGGPGPFRNAHLATDQLMRQVEDLEVRNAELQTICDERQLIIDELARAANERLELIGQLQQIAQQRLAVINEIDAALKSR